MKSIYKHTQMDTDGLGVLEVLGWVLIGPFTVDAIDTVQSLFLVFGY